MNKFLSKRNDEIESIIYFDNLNQNVNVYSTRNASIKKITKYIGEPSNADYINGKIFSAEWNIPFSDRLRIRKALSINIYFLKKK